MDQLRGTRRSSRLAAASLLATAGLLLAGGVASAKGDPHATPNPPAGTRHGSTPAKHGAGGSSNHGAPGDSNAGDVWTDNVGQPSGPGHEQDPHLACADINIWGSGLADASGTYTIDGWPPSGSQEQDYASTWSYDTAAGGTQVISVVSYQSLITNAVSNGDTAQNQNGFHFKLNLVQDPQKHKTFWLACATQPSPAPTTAAARGAGGSGFEAASTNASTSAASGAPLQAPGRPAGGPGAVLGVATAAPAGVAGAVLGLSTSTPSTGTAIAFGLAAALLAAGTVAVVLSRRRRQDQTS